MSASQQNQALAYFSEHADDWQRKAAGLLDIYPVIEARHRAVHHAVAQIGASRILDIGCGTGQLAIELTRDGRQAVGVDFAPQMIDRCKENAASAKSGASFHCASVFDLPEMGKFDLISAQGFIEYITLDQLTQFLSICHGLLEPGGCIAIGSRNRLFNVCSLNDYTTMERDLGQLDALVSESVALQEAASAEAFLGKLEGGTRWTYPESHPHTGIDVTTRHQFTPADLAGRIRDAGFAPLLLYPVNFHAMPASMKPANEQLHANIALGVESVDYPNHRIIPRCSSYVLSARVS